MEALPKLNRAIIGQLDAVKAQQDVTLPEDFAGWGCRLDASYEHTLLAILSTSKLRLRCQAVAQEEQSEQICSAVHQAQSRTSTPDVDQAEP